MDKLLKSPKIVGFGELKVVELGSIEEILKPNKGVIELSITPKVVISKTAKIIC